MNKILFGYFVMLLVLVPALLFGEEITPVAEAVLPAASDPTGLLVMIKAAPWYGIAVMVVGALKFITPFISDEFMGKYPILKFLNTGLNWLALNVFGDKNQKKVS